VNAYTRDTPYVDRPEVVCDIAHGRGLGLVGGFADALCPEDSVDVVRPRGVDNSISISWRVVYAEQRTDWRQWAEGVEVKGEKGKMVVYAIVRVQHP